MTIHVVSRRRAATSIARDFPGAEVVDVTSKGPPPWVMFSPFYPHGGIPVPGTATWSSESVEGIWQALKVFHSEPVDTSKLHITTMRGLKRTVRRRGSVRGHQYGTRLLSYVEARRKIYLPSYTWVLQNRLSAQVTRLRHIAAQRDLVLLDYNVTGDVTDVSRPLSHAALLRDHLASAPPEPGPGSA